MEKIISYGELPFTDGQSVYMRMETDPKLYINLISKGYKVVNNIYDADASTIFITGRRQLLGCKNAEEYKEIVDKTIQSFLLKKGIAKPSTMKFSLDDLLNYRYQLPFVLKNEHRNGGKEKFLIANEQDYENLINACNCLLDKNLMYLTSLGSNNAACQVNYGEYLEDNFFVQEYIPTPSDYNTTVRLLTSSSNDLLYGALKYNEPGTCMDNSTLLEYLLRDVYPLTNKSIVSNTLSGGENILIGEANYSEFEKGLLASHGIRNEQFDELVSSTQAVHEMCHSELGLLCGFDFIYDINRQKWFLLEYHSKPMVGDYSKRQGLAYNNKEDRLTADGRVRATALSLTLKKR